MTAFKSLRAFALCLFVLGFSNHSATAQTMILTQHNDISRTGQNLNETTLTPSNVTASQFGKLYAIQLDAQTYTQPLYMGSLTIGSVSHSVLFVATENDSVYAFDTATNGAPLWKASLLDAAHGAAAGAIADPNSTTGCGNIEGGIDGITGTPVIDPSTGTMYVVSRSNEGGSVVYRLHALDVTTGNEKFGGPTVITASVAGTAGDGKNGVVTFNPVLQKQAPALLLEAGSIYIGFGSFCDTSPWHGWFMQYNAATLAQQSVFLSTPNGVGSGIWMSGAGPAADNENGTPRVFITSGNGTYDASAPYATNTVDYGDDVLSFSVTNGLKVGDSFTPSNQSTLQAEDADLGSGGIMLLPDNLPGSSVAHLAVQVDKVGTLFLLNRDNLGGYNTSSDNVLQEITTTQYGAGLWGSPAYWNGNIYFWPMGSNAQQFSITNGLLSTSPVATGPDPGAPSTDFFAGSTPSVSANGTTNGIVWFNDWANSVGGPLQVLYAYNATNISTLLWSSAQNPVRDGAGPTQKFSVPTVADGRVYLANRNQIAVYGLLANQTVTGVTVNLANVANVYAIGSNGTVPTNGGLDTEGYSYASNYLGSSAVWNSTNFSFGAANTLSGVSSATIPLPTGNYTALNLLATAVNGVQTNQVFTVTYADGTTTSVTQSISDWGGPQGYTSESTALSTASRVNPSGALNSGPWYLYGYIIPLNSAKQVASVTTPNNRNVVVLAASLTPVSTTATTATPTFSVAAGTYTSTQQVSLSDATSGATIYYTTNGSTPTTGSTVYSAPISVSATTTINALAVSSNAANSPVASATYTIQPAPTFTITPATNPWTLQQNAGATQTIAVTPVNGFTCPGSVALSVSGAPSGVGTGFSGNTLIVYPPLATPTGTYPLTLTGTCGSTKVTTPLALVITAGANFTLSAASSSLSLAPGASATDAISVTPSNGFSGAVSFSASGFPSGASGSFSPTSSASGTTLSIATTSAVAAGTYSIVITATAPGSGNSSSFSNSITVNLVIAAAKTPGFTLAAAANPLTLQQNAGGTDTITVTPVNGFSGNVSLAVSGAPSGVGTAFSGNLLIVYPPLTTPTGTYPLTITGTSGSTSATATVSLVITAGATFTLAPASTSLTVPHGSSGTDAITVKPANGFNSAVSFAASGLPTGVTASFSPSSSATSSTLTLAAASSAKPGSYTITITATAPGSGNSNSFTQTTTLSLTIS